MTSHHSERLDPAGARGLQMADPTRRLGEQRIDGELVGTGVQGQLVGAERPSDLGVPVEVLGQRVQGADVFDPLLELPDPSRREAHKFDAETLQLAHDDDVLDRRGRLLGLVDGELELMRPAERFSRG